MSRRQDFRGSSFERDPGGLSDKEVLAYGRDLSQAKTSEVVIHDHRDGIHLSLWFAKPSNRPRIQILAVALSKLCGARLRRDSQPRAGDFSAVAQEHYHSPPVHTFIKETRPSGRQRLAALAAERKRKSR